MTLIETKRCVLLKQLCLGQRQVPAYSSSRYYKPPVYCVLLLELLYRDGASTMFNQTFNPLFNATLNALKKQLLRCTFLAYP